MPWTNQDRCQIQVDYNGEVATIVFDRAKMTPRWVKQTQQPDVEAVSKALVEVVLEWGPVEDGSMRAPTLEEMLDVPFAAQVNLATKMLEEVGPSSEEGNALSKPSLTSESPVGSSSGDSANSHNGTESLQPTAPSPASSTAQSPT